MHPESEYLFKKLLWNLKIDGLDAFLKWYNESKNFLETSVLYNLVKLSFIVLTISSGVEHE